MKTSVFYYSLMATCQSDFPVMRDGCTFLAVEGKHADEKWGVCGEFEE
jgi:hypothetical protein